MSEIILLLKALQAAGITLPQVLLLLEKFGPAIEAAIALGKTIFELIGNVLKLFQGFVHAGDDPARAADTAFTLGLHIRPATPEEMERIHPMGFPPDAMHDFEHGFQ